MYTNKYRGMARLYCMNGADNDFLQDVRVNAIEGQYFITIQNDANEYLRSHSNGKQLYWDHSVDGVMNYFTFDLDTNRIKTIFHKYVKFDEPHGFRQYSGHCADDTEGSVLLYGIIENRSEKEFYDVVNNKRT